MRSSAFRSRPPPHGVGSVQCRPLPFQLHVTSPRPERARPSGGRRRWRRAAMGATATQRSVPMIRRSSARRNGEPEIAQAEDLVRATARRPGCQWTYDGSVAASAGAPAGWRPRAHWQGMPLVVRLVPHQVAARHPRATRRTSDTSSPLAGFARCNKDSSSSNPTRVSRECAYLARPHHLPPTVS